MTATAWLCVALWAGGALGWGAALQQDGFKPWNYTAKAAAWPAWLAFFIAFYIVRATFSRRPL